MQYVIPCHTFNKLKINNMIQKVIPILMLVAIAATASCSAKKNKLESPSSPVIAVMETTMYNALGDSIYYIIRAPKKVEISCLPSQSDSLKRAINKKVSSKELEIMKFIVTNPKNYMTNTTVYGVFMPQFQAVYTQKKAKIILKYDFGLRKWGIFDADDKQIAMFDLASDNMLRFACKMFPDNDFFHNLLLTRES